MVKVSSSSTGATVFSFRGDERICPISDITRVLEILYHKNRHRTLCSTTAVGGPFLLLTLIGIVPCMTLRLVYFSSIFGYSGNVRNAGMSACTAGRVCKSTMSFAVLTARCRPSSHALNTLVCLDLLSRALDSYLSGSYLSTPVSCRRGAQCTNSEEEAGGDQDSPTCSKEKAGLVCSGEVEFVRGNKCLARKWSIMMLFHFVNLQP